jgi:hypothetical protein
MDQLQIGRGGLRIDVTLRKVAAGLRKPSAQVDALCQCEAAALRQVGCSRSLCMEHGGNQKRKQKSGDAAERGKGHRGKAAPVWMRGATSTA